MRNRFSDYKPFYQRISFSSLFVICTIIVLTIFLYAITTLNSVTKDKQVESLKNNINQCIMHCYAVEGSYPPSLNYLKEHYGLIYDENSFFIDYTSIGSNLMPDITIIKKGE